MALRRELHRRGLRFRVVYPVPGNGRRSIDIAFTRSRLAVFVDGCFWHGCPEHGTLPLSNRDWWRTKLEVNRARDRDTDELLAGAGWDVLRFWEHVPTTHAADKVEDLLAGVARSPGSQPGGEVSTASSKSPVLAR